MIGLHYFHHWAMPFDLYDRGGAGSLVGKKAWSARMGMGVRGSFINV